MKLKIAACFFAFLEALMLGAQLTTLISTYWTSWDLRFDWKETDNDFTRRPTSGQLISEGHAGLWSRCVRAYDASKREPFFNCLYNYDTSNGSLKLTYGKACKTAAAALCLGDSAVTVGLFVLVLALGFRAHASFALARLALFLVLLQGLICCAIPLTYLAGNMAELIDQLTVTYDYLPVVRIRPYYIHDWAFWTQVGIAGSWVLSVGVFVVFYALKNTQNFKRHNKFGNGGDTEMESLKS